MISGKVFGKSKLLMALKNLEAEVKSGSIAATQRATLLIHETAVKLVQDNTDGRPEIRSNPRRVVNVSDPGDPPNTDRGRLVQSIKFDFQRGGLVGRVGSNLKYAAWLEFGTLRMAPRPWLSRAVAIAGDKVGAIFEEETSKAIRGATE